MTNGVAKRQRAAMTIGAALVGIALAVSTASRPSLPPTPVASQRPIVQTAPADFAPATAAVAPSGVVAPPTVGAKSGNGPGMITASPAASAILQDTQQSDKNPSTSARGVPAAQPEKVPECSSGTRMKKGRCLPQEVRSNKKIRRRRPDR
jgi:hypothetical protein